MTASTDRLAGIIEKLRSELRLDHELERERLVKILTDLENFWTILWRRGE